MAGRRRGQGEAANSRRCLQQSPSVEEKQFEDLKTQPQLHRRLYHPLRCTNASVGLENGLASLTARQIHRRGQEDQSKTHVLMLKWSRPEHAKLPDTSQVTRKVSQVMQAPVTSHFTATCQLDVAFCVLGSFSP